MSGEGGRNSRNQNTQQTHPPGGFYSRVRLTREGVPEVFAPSDTADGLMIDHPELVRLQSAGTTVEDVLAVSPERPLVATSTVPDEYLKTLSLKEELTPVRAVNPHWYLPFDVPTYKDGDMDPEIRAQNLEDYIHGVRRVATLLHEAECQTRVLPLLKGVYADELRYCYDHIEPLADGYVGVYVGQFFGPKAGNQIRQCREWLRTIDAVCDPTGIVLIGLGSPRYLEGLPASVVAAAGRYVWLRETEFLDTPIEEAHRRLRALRAEISEAVGTGYNQLSLQQFSQEAVHG
ncbi:hypothetical protein [Halomarina rubra]|uniref:Uncharacterized protein n=1 Tax=Halomarina rubra TaxID=2071873 RepID=A0ABD6AVQ2_9EURY|nr:hypothetical protein [Halomarina rubra]